MEKWAPKERKKEREKKAQKMESNLAIYDTRCCNIELKNPKVAVIIISVYFKYE